VVHREPSPPPQGIFSGSPGTLRDLLSPRLGHSLHPSGQQGRPPVPARSIFKAAVCFVFLVPFRALLFVLSGITIVTPTPLPGQRRHPVRFGLPFARPSPPVVGSDGVVCPLRIRPQRPSPDGPSDSFPSAGRRCRITPRCLCLLPSEDSDAHRTPPHPDGGGPLRFHTDRRAAAWRRLGTLRRSSTAPRRTPPCTPRAPAAAN